MQRYQVLNRSLLGQTDARGESSAIQLDRPLAEYGHSAINLLKSLQEHGDVVTSIPCWRELLILRRAEVERLYDELHKFISGSGSVLSLPASQYQVFDKVISCVFEVEKDQATSKRVTLQTMATLVGALGGTIALISLL
jgi:hypothetical protein